MNDMMRNLSIQLSDHNNQVSGINRNSPSRTSIRISPPIVPNNDTKTNLRTNSSANVMRSDSEPHSLIHNQTAVHPNNLMANNCNDFGSNDMYSHPFYDTNNYMSHINKMNKYGLTVQQQSSMGVPNMCAMNGASGQSSSMTTTAVITNGITSANLNPMPMNNSRVSLDDHGVDVGRVSPSTSSNDSRKSRYSSASLDSGRGSDTKIELQPSGQSHRVSVHSCESLGSQSSNKDNYNYTGNSSSSSSIGSGNSATIDADINTICAANNVVDYSNNRSSTVSGAGVGASITGPLSIPEMVLHGIADEEIIHSWLSRIHFEEYVDNFIRAGYDMPTISRMTPEDLTAIGITKPQKRQILKTEIQKLSIADGIPSFKPNSLLEWLKILRLEEYFSTLCQQGYDSIDRVTELAWEDLEEVGIAKLGHQKKIMLAIKRIQSVNNNTRLGSQVSNSSHNLSLPLIYSNNSSCADGINRGHTNGGYQIPVNTQFQDTVPIKMFAPTKSTPSPTAEQPPMTPQLKTFQQLPNNGFMFCRQRSEDPYMQFVSNDTQNAAFQSYRGRSLESLDNNENNYYNMYCAKPQQNNVFNGFAKQTPFCDNDMTRRDCDQIHGYETDSELMNSYANNRKMVYEIDGTATLHRPKGLIKAKPIAKIVAKSRQTDSNSYNNQIYDSQKTNSFDKYSVSQSDVSLQNNYISDNSKPNPYYQDVNPDIYASLKRKKVPPPPPKRVNSMRNTPNSSPLYAGPVISSFNPNPHAVHRQSYDQFQEQVFASCVKSLTSRFSMSGHSEDMNTSAGGRQSRDCGDYANDFPPPPSPLPFNECQNYNTLQRKRDKMDRDCNISSSSSTESMPFANDNVGTIKQRVSIDYTDKDIHNSPAHSYTYSAPTSMTNSPSSPSHQNITRNVMSEDFSNKRSDSNVLTKMVSPVKHRPVDHQRMLVNNNGTPPVSNGLRADPLDDIETMLVNLSNQLDLMLETDHHKRNN